MSSACSALSTRIKRVGRRARSVCGPASGALPVSAMQASRKSISRGRDWGQLRYGGGGVGRKGEDGELGGRGGHQGARGWRWLVRRSEWREEAA